MSFFRMRSCSLPTSGSSSRRSSGSASVRRPRWWAHEALIGIITVRHGAREVAVELYDNSISRTAVDYTRYA